MIFRRTSLTVADNSGAQEIVVIHIYGASKKVRATVGDIVQCVIKKADSRGLLKEHELVPTVIVRTKKEHRRRDGSFIRFDDNAGVIIDNVNDKNPRGTRIFGPIARELKDRGFDKIVSLAQEVY